jgi:hypothetical protein
MESGGGPESVNTDGGVCNGEIDGAVMGMDRPLGEWAEL